MALVEGAVFKKDSSIRFRIQAISNVSLFCQLGCWRRFGTQECDYVQFLSIQKWYLMIVN
jgi:hypothetical protein